MIILFLLLMIYILFKYNSSKKLLDNRINSDNIDAIQFVFTGGDPRNGYASKIITDRDEITRIIYAFKNATVGKRVEPREGGYTKCYFFCDDLIVHQFCFNGIQLNEFRTVTGYYNVQYPEATLYELYGESKAEVIIVDSDLYSQYPKITLSEVYQRLKIAQ